MYSSYYTFDYDVEETFFNRKDKEKEKKICNVTLKSLDHFLIYRRCL